MDKVFNETNRLLHPIFLISVYSTSKDAFSSAQTYMQYHEINDDGSYAHAMPVPDDVLTNFSLAVSNSLSLNSNYHGPIPGNLMYYHMQGKELNMIWHTQPQKVFMFFDDSLNIKSRYFWVPGLVWVVSGNRLSVFAWKEFEGEDTELYYGPFHNVSSGVVCLGSSKLTVSGTGYTDIMKAWEDSFWNSKFVHNHGIATKISVTAIYKKLGNKPFPLDELVTAKKKVKDLW